MNRPDRVQMINGKVPYRYSDWQTHGIVAALVMQYIRQKLFEERKHWTCATIQEMTDYLNKLDMPTIRITYAKVRNATNKLIDLGVLKDGNYNRNTYDRSKWYSFTNNDDL